MLTAINVVSQINAPEHRGQANFKSLRLDAQVAAAEGCGQLIPFVLLTGTFES